MMDQVIFVVVGICGDDDPIFRTLPSSVQFLFAVLFLLFHHLA